MEHPESGAAYRRLAICVCGGAAHRPVCGQDVSLSLAGCQAAEGRTDACSRSPGAVRSLAGRPETDGCTLPPAPEWASKGQTDSRKAADWTILDSELFACSLGSV